MRRVSGAFGSPTAILTQPKRGRGPHHHVEAAVELVQSQVFVSWFKIDCNVIVVLIKTVTAINCFCGNLITVGVGLCNDGSRLIWWVWGRMKSICWRIFDPNCSKDHFLKDQLF